MTTTQQDEMITRIRGYIDHNASKGPQAIKSLVGKGHEALYAMIDGLSEEQRTFKPAPDVWSVVEVLRHVAQAKKGVARVCAGLARGETPRDVGAEGQDGMTNESLSFDDALSSIERSHEELLAFIDALSTDVDLDTRHKHFLFGDLNCRQWAAFQRVHDGDHTNQIEQVKAAPGFPAE